MLKGTSDILNKSSLKPQDFVSGAQVITGVVTEVIESVNDTTSAIEARIAHPAYLTLQQELSFYLNNEVTRNFILQNYLYSVTHELINILLPKNNITFKEKINRITAVNKKINTLHFYLDCILPLEKNSDIRLKYFAVFLEGISTIFHLQSAILEPQSELLSTQEKQSHYDMALRLFDLAQKYVPKTKLLFDEVLTNKSTLSNKTFQEMKDKLLDKYLRIIDIYSDFAVICAYFKNEAALSAYAFVAENLGFLSQNAEKLGTSAQKIQTLFKSKARPFQVPDTSHYESVLAQVISFNNHYTNHLDEINSSTFTVELSPKLFATVINQFEDFMDKAHLIPDIAAAYGNLGVSLEPLLCQMIDHATELTCHLESCNKNQALQLLLLTQELLQAWYFKINYPHMHAMQSRLALVKLIASTESSIGKINMKNGMTHNPGAIQQLSDIADIIDLYKRNERVYRFLIDDLVTLSKDIPAKIDQEAYPKLLDQCKDILEDKIGVSILQGYASRLANTIVIPKENASTQEFIESTFDFSKRINSIHFILYCDHLLESNPELKANYLMALIDAIDYLFQNICHLREQKHARRVPDKIRLSLLQIHSDLVPIFKKYEPEVKAIFDNVLFQRETATHDNASAAIKANLYLFYKKLISVNLCHWRICEFYEEIKEQKIASYLQVKYYFDFLTTYFQKILAHAPKQEELNIKIHNILQTKVEELNAYYKIKPTTAYEICWQQLVQFKEQCEIILNNIKAFNFNPILTTEEFNALIDTIKNSHMIDILKGSNQNSATNTVEDNLENLEYPLSITGFIPEMIQSMPTIPIINAISSLQKCSLAQTKELLPHLREFLGKWIRFFNELNLPYTLLIASVLEGMQIKTIEAAVKLAMAQMKLSKMEQQITEKSQNITKVIQAANVIQSSPSQLNKTTQTKQATVIKPTVQTMPQVQAKPITTPPKNEKAAQEKKQATASIKKPVEKPSTEHAVSYFSSSASELYSSIKRVKPPKENKASAKKSFHTQEVGKQKKDKKAKNKNEAKTKNNTSNQKQTPKNATPYVITGSKINTNNKNEKATREERDKKEKNKHLSKEAIAKKYDQGKQLFKVDKPKTVNLIAQSLSTLTLKAQEPDADKQTTQQHLQQPDNLMIEEAPKHDADLGLVNEFAKLSVQEEKPIDDQSDMQLEVYNEHAMDYIPICLPYEPTKKCIKINDPLVIDILTTLNRHGYWAVLCGGAVRDLLSKKIPNDWDITTNCLKEKLNDIILQAKINFLDKNKNKFKVNEHIDITCTSLKLEEELLKRDFYENTFIADRNGRVYDLLKKKHLLLNPQLNHKLHVIGLPTERFAEDPSIAIRLLRLTAKAGKSIFDYLKPLHQVKHLFTQLEFGIYLKNMKELFGQGNALVTWHNLRQNGLIDFLLPGAHEIHFDPNLDLNPYYLFMSQELATIDGNSQNEGNTLSAYRPISLLRMTDVINRQFEAPFIPVKDHVKNSLKHFCQNYLGNFTENDKRSFSKIMKRDMLHNFQQYEGYLNVLNQANQVALTPYFQTQQQEFGNYVENTSTSTMNWNPQKPR